MFASLRRCLGCPLEYTNSHLRRQMVIWMAQQGDYLVSTHRIHLLGMLAAPSHLGPHSLKEYLLEMLDDGTWGDRFMLECFSMMFNVAISIVIAESLVVERVRHEREVGESDIVLVYSGGNHYVAAGMFNISVVFPINLVRCADCVVVLAAIRV